LLQGGHRRVGDWSWDGVAGCDRADGRCGLVNGL
jgi:hypothetical protein